MNQQNTEMNQTVDNLARQASSRFGGGTGGMTILTGIVVLSGVLSAIFFWENSAQVFVRVWPPAALLLGLAVGLLPSEGAFFGWKKVRESKTEMTTAQMRMTTLGIAFAVFFSIFSTFALFVSSFPDVPESILQYRSWFTFIALAVPVLVQFALFAVFVVNETSVIQNHQRAKVGALRFDSLIRFEQARVMSALLGMEAELNRQLNGYGAQVGTDNANAFLGDRPRTLTDMPDHQLPGVALSPEDTARVAAVLHNKPASGITDRVRGVLGRNRAIDEAALAPPQLDARNMAVEDLIALLASDPQLAGRALSAVGINTYDMYNAPPQSATHARDDNGAPRPPIGGGGSAGQERTGPNF
jgi:hypothetical protein